MYHHKKGDKNGKDEWKWGFVQTDHSFWVTSARYTKKKGRHYCSHTGES
ncbi:unnamed protein product [Periconia digitata]|uniref:Uncharacterized protein n=1 Tax=Periconia digitata TaxID=1303443 RepID=A0A9W4XKZ9_9PLEO|nr:unnamed protein product [Periconia digitata]